MKTLRSALIALTLLALIPALAACNTVHGMGEDIKAAGGAISDAGK